MKIKTIIKIVVFRPLPELIKLNYILICFFEIRFSYFGDFVSRYLRCRLLRKYGVEICKGAVLSKSVIFKHPTGIVIGGGAVIEDDVIIHQGVTFGAKNFDDAGKGEEAKQLIKRGAIIGAGAKVIGNVEIGENSIVSANSVVTRSVPANCIVYGVNKVKKKHSGT
ncbi:hypothetical protein AYI72_00990 [Shewanella algae]|uniref:serine O-acetyltransferase n=1 Tax=Shewanella algae TaxID=38313 RepID=UPI0016432824|nr:serine acetyltransferase [Shewanella algae]TVL09938.1 hypothetical protein AYI72_00990 [Shewanella algae]